MSKDKGLSLGGWMAVVCLVPVFYVLSIGPVVLLCDRVQPSGTVLDVLAVVYAPVGWAYDETALEGPLDAYFAWWRSLGRKNFGGPP